MHKLRMKSLDTVRIGTQTRRDGRFAEAGVALLTALTLLFLLSMLGASFIVFSANRLDSTRLQVQGARAREAARGGIYAGLGEIQEALTAGRAPQSAYAIDLPVYAWTPPSSGIAARPNMRASATIQIAALPGDGKYTITSTGACGKTAADGGLYHSSSVKAQAVIVFTEGPPRILEWSEAPVGKEESPAAPAS